MKAAQKTINHGGERDAWLQYFECNWNLEMETVNVLRLERVAGPPCTARPLSLTVG